MSETRWPLSWPEGWKRCVNRERARFGRIEKQYGQQRTDGSRPSWGRSRDLTVADGVTRVLETLQKMGLPDVDATIISTNVEPRLDGLPRSNRGEPSDPGVAVYWRDAKGRKKCMAVDRYDRVADNLAAIAATLEAMRAIERHGGAEILERTFLGFAQLPERNSRPWRIVLGVAGDRVTREFIEAQFKSLARVRHPDAGGSQDAMAELNAARAQALTEVS
jgi:hypothetical protein